MTDLKNKFEPVTRANFDALKSLVLEQAQHHACSYTGDDAEFIAHIERPNPVSRFLFMRDDATQTPLGYILYNEIYGLKGREFYIEDITVSGQHRSRGAGMAMMEALKETGRRENIDEIIWMVANNNPHAIRFYRDKVQAAEQTHHLVYDCVNFFASAAAPSPNYEVRIADAGDLDLIESYAGRIKTLDADTVKNIRAAAAAPNAEVYIALGTDGTPKAVGIANSNFSSFRTVYGYKFEMMELQTDHTGDAREVFRALTAQVAADGRAKGHTGHFNLLIDKHSIAQSLFTVDIGADRLRMSDDPASFFDTFTLDRSAIHGPAAKPAPAQNIPLPKKVA